MQIRAESGNEKQALPPRVRQSFLVQSDADSSNGFEPSRPPAARPRWRLTKDGTDGTGTDDNCPEWTLREGMMGGRRVSWGEPLFPSGVVVWSGRDIYHAPLGSRSLPMLAVLHFDAGM